MMTKETNKDRKRCRMLLKISAVLKGDERIRKQEATDMRTKWKI